MKRIIYRIGLVAALAVAVIGCSKNDEINPSSKGRTITVTFTKDAGTKTAVVDEGGSAVSYVWTEDAKECFHVYENGVAGTVNSVAYADNKATLSVTFTGEPTATEYVYTAVFAKTLSGNNAVIASVQKPTANSFDPEVDIMVAEPITSTTPLTSETPLKFVLNRKVSVNKMTLTGMEPGEQVQKVEVTFSEPVGGNYNWADDSYEVPPSSKTLTFNYSGATVATDGTFPVFFVINPVSAGFEKVSVTTNLNYYNKDITYATNPFAGKTINLACGKFTKFNMGLFAFASSYTLTPSAQTSGSSSYDGTTDVFYKGITWNVQGITNVKPWRIGAAGKSLSVSRTIFSETAIPFNASSIKILHSGSNISKATVSITLTVSANKQFTGTPVFSQTQSLSQDSDSDIEFKYNNSTSTQEWGNCYFKIVYHISFKGNHDQYVGFNGIQIIKETN